MNRTARRILVVLALVSVTPAFGTTINNVPRPLSGKCSHDATISCYQNTDCGGANTCTNPEPGANGGCSDDPTRRCTKNADCVAGTCTNPPRAIAGRCSNNAALFCFERSDCGAGSCDTPPARLEGRCAFNNAKGCFNDAECGAGGKCLNGPKPFWLREEPQPAGARVVHHSFTTDGIGREAIVGAGYESNLTLFGQPENRPRDTVMQQCFGGGFARGYPPGTLATLTSAASFYESANNVQYDAAGGCSNDATKKCVQDSDCGAGNTCSNPAMTKSPWTGGCSNHPPTRCSRDADCSGRCTNFAAFTGCLANADCGTCAADAAKRCSSRLDCNGGPCNAPPAGTCTLGATCSSPLPGAGFCVQNGVFNNQRCLSNANCAPGFTCEAAGPGRCSNDNTILCLNNVPCAPAGTCTNPAPKPLVRGVDNFTRAWRQSAKDRTDKGFLDHAKAAALGVGGSIAAGATQRTDLPLKPEHEQYRSPDAADGGPNNSRTLAGLVGQSKLYAILVAWGHPEPRHEVNVARVYHTLLTQYGVPESRVVLLYGNLPTGTRIGNYPARADGEPALYGGVSPQAAADVSLVNPNNAQGFLVNGPNSPDNFIAALKGTYYPANDKPANGDRLFVYHTGHGGHRFTELKQHKLQNPGPGAAVIADWGVWILMPVPYYASYLLDSVQGDGTLTLDIRVAEPFDLLAYPNLSLQLVNTAGVTFDAGRFADHPEWDDSGSGPDVPVPGEPPGTTQASYRLDVPASALLDGTDDLQYASVRLDGVDESFFALSSVTAIRVGGVDWDIWSTPAYDGSLGFADKTHIALAPSDPDETYDVAYARFSGSFPGSFSTFAAFACDVSGSIDIASAGTPPARGLDLWIARLRTNLGQTAESWDEGGMQYRTRDNGPAGVPAAVCP